MAKILVADDEPEVVQLCGIALAKRNHTVIAAANGPQALELIKREKPDLLLLDVMLPGMDGYTVQLQMAQDESLRGIPVIVISALRPTQSLFEKFGQVRQFLDKPFQIDDLIAAVDRALQK